MDQPTMVEVHAVVEATCATLLESIQRDMPASGAATFWQWVLAPSTPQRAVWVQLMGIQQVAKLTVHLLDGLVPDRAWPALVPMMARMNTYLTYEVISDNLAIGCAGRNPSSPDAQHHVLRQFNLAMMQRLTDHRAPVVLPTAANGALGLSIVDQSLTPCSMRTLVTTFEHAFPHIGAVEYDLWPVLAANIAAAGQVVDSISHTQYQALVRQGMIARYVGSQRLLNAADQAWTQRIITGRDTILVHPVLGYYASLLQTLWPGDAIDLGQLAPALEHAAIVVRLLNDIGTPLLDASAAERAAHCQEVIDLGQAAPADTLFDLLNQTRPPTVWSRIMKDLQFGEWNLVLPPWPGWHDRMHALTFMMTTLDQAATAYHVHHRAVSTLTRQLARSPLGSRMALLITRFIQFHQQVYRHDFTTPAGEYASGDDRRVPAYERYA